MKKLWIVCCLLALLLAGSALADTSGTCGDQTAWTMSADGTLTLTGQGAVSVYDVEWDDLETWRTVKKLIVSEGITEIGNESFKDCASLTEVKLPASLTKIGSSAFSGCEALASVTLPDHTEVSNDSFDYECVLYAVVGSDTAVHMGLDANRVFHAPGSPVKLRYEYVFYGLSDEFVLRALGVEGDPQEVDIPDGVDEINWGAFSNCSHLISVFVPDSVKSIDPGVFQGAHRDFYVRCNPGSHAEQVALRYGLQYDNGQKRVIGYQITDYEEKVRWILSNYVRSGMSEQEKAEVLHNWLIYNAHYDGTYTYYSSEGVILHGMGVCESYALAYLDLLSRAGVSCKYMRGYVTTSSSGHAWNLVRIGRQWYHVDTTWDDHDNTGGEDEPVIAWESKRYFLVDDATMREDHSWDDDISADTGDVGYYTDNGTDWHTDGTGTYKCNTKKKTATLLEGNLKKKTVKIPATVDGNGVDCKVTAIADGAFQGSKKLTTLVIGKNVKKIGKNAFAGCGKLKTITIQTAKLTAKTIGAAAFKGIAKKPTVKLPAKQFKTYKKILLKRGVPKAAKFKK